MHSYPILVVVILLGILGFYLSCKSKSPTEPASTLHNQVASQSTNNTTTSSSTTTTIKPGNSPTNTTTLITSRYLTTTSTSSSTTSTSSSSTTTTSIATTSIANPDLKFCRFHIEFVFMGHVFAWDIKNGCLFASCGKGSFNVYPKMKNVGTAAAENVIVTLVRVVKSREGITFNLLDDSAFLGTIPADRACVSASNGDKISFAFPDILSGDQLVLTFQESFSNKTFTITFRCFG